MSLLLSGCTDKVKDIRISSFKISSFNFQGTKSIKFLTEVGINNPSIGLELSEVRATLKYKKQDFLHLSFDRLVLEPRIEKIYQLPLTGAIADGFNPLQLLDMLDLQENNNDLSVSLRGRVSLRGGLGKDFDIQDIPLNTLIPNIEAL